MSSFLFPGNQINRTTGIHRSIVPGIGTFVNALGVVDITSTVATVFDVKFRSGQADKADTTGLTIPIGSVLHYIGFRIPSTVDPSGSNLVPLLPALIATNGDRLKLATAVGATGTQAFNATGSTAYVASSVAASGTFAAEEKKFAISPFQGSATPAAADFSVALSGAITLKLFNDNGTTGAGSGVSVASGSQQIIVLAQWWESTTVPYADQVVSRPSRAVVG